MGSITNGVIQGIFCEVCLTIIDGKESGYPRKCEDCKRGEEMELTDIEKNIVEQYRNGASVSITHFNAETYEQAMEYLDGHKITSIGDFDGFIVFKAGSLINGEVSFTVYIDK